MFAELVRTHRQRLGFSQDELAAKTGLSVRSIRNLEAGRTSTPRPASLRLLADAFGLTGAERDTFCQAAANPLTTQPSPDRHHIPAQLPADIAGFTGREEQLARLDTLLAGTADPSTAVVISAIAGTAGVGKTALAIHWAHHVASRFPGGQLYVNLRGYSPGTPLTPLEALAGFLHALGLRGPDIPPTLDQAAATYRTMVADRQLLVVLDNARDAEQVRPLLPGTASCLALVTSRDKLGGLVARDGAHWMDLDVLTADEARTLLVRVLGAKRVGEEPEEAGELAKLCGNLPLALQIGAANLATQPRHRIADYVAQLRGRDPLRTLTVAGDPHSGVAAAFQTSYVRLPDPARRLFRLLGLVPGPEVTAEAAAALAEVSMDEAAELLRVLHTAHLLQEHAAGRYCCHDLLRRYATSRAEHEETRSDRDAAWQRLLGWYFQSAQVAADVLYPEWLRLPAGQVPVAVVPPAVFDSPNRAQAWLTAEHANLVCAITHGAQQGQRWLASRLADTLRGFWWQSGYLPEWETSAAAAQDAARGDGDLLGQAAAYFSLGTLRQRQGRYSEALALHGSARELARQVGWDEGQAGALANCAVIDWHQGRLDHAASQFIEMRALCRTHGWPRFEARAVDSLGGVYLEMGRLAQAAIYLTQSLAMYRELDGPHGTNIPALINLGLVKHGLGQLQDAEDQLTHALARCRETGNRANEASALAILAALRIDQGRHVEALELAEASLQLGSELGDTYIEATARSTLGDAHQHLHHLHPALDHQQQALALAQQAGDSESEIGALLGLAATHHDLGQHDRALAHAAKARDLGRERRYQLREGQALTALARTHLARHDHHQAQKYADLALANHSQTGHRLGEARTQLVLGHLRSQAGDASAAYDHWRQAHKLFVDIGTPESGQTATLLPNPSATGPEG